MWRRNQDRVVGARNKKNNNNSSNKKNNATKSKDKRQKMLKFEETRQMLAVVSGFGKTCQALLLKTHKVLNSVPNTLPYWH